MTETWRKIPALTHYEVSSEGRIRSLDHSLVRGNGVKLTRKGQLLKLTPQKRTGHLKFRAQSKTYMVHWAVLTAFVGERPPGFVACHGEGGVADNSLTNLRWDTIKENNRDKIRHGNDHNSAKTHCPSGHSYDKKNTAINSRGARVCRICSNLASAAYKKRSA